MVEQPFVPLTARYDTLYSSRGKDDAPKNELLDKNFAVERRVKTGPQRKLLQLTEKGREYVEQHEDMELNRAGRGGIVHQFWQKTIMDAVEDLGWTAKRELFDADVYVMMDGTELVIEVAMGDNEREIDHVKEHVERFDSDYCSDLPVRPHDVVWSIRNRPTIITVIPFGLPVAPAASRMGCRRGWRSMGCWTE